ncbi:MAG: hypothetical protein WDO56_02360 [Gammaproteobacteria bacterium]
MFDTARSPAKPTIGARRMLGNEPAAVGYAIGALLLTLGIVVLQMNLRAGRYDPENLRIFYRLFAFEDYAASFLFMACLLLGAVPQVQNAAAALAKAIGAHPLAVSIGAGAAFAAGALGVYHAFPLAMDEAAPYMQSKAFAAGELVGRYPQQLLDWLVVPGFQNYFIYVSRETGEVASAYWPGFALLLTPFMALGVPWLCNPVLGAASVWVIHRLTLALTQSVAAAGAAMLFTLASAAFVVNAMSFYAMTAHLLCNAIFALLLLKPSPGRCFAAGLTGGLALTLHNPVPHMLFAAVWLVWLANNKNRWKLLASIAAGYLPWIIVVGFGWYHLLQGLANSAAVAGESQPLIAKALALLARVFKWPHTTELMSRLVGAAKTWLWSAPLVLLLAGAGFWRQRGNTHFRLLLASTVTTFVAYLFVPLDQGHGWGYRYFHSVWFVLPIFAAAALAAPRDAATDGAAPRSSPLSQWTQGAALAGGLVLVPYFAWQVHAFIGTHLAQIPRADHGRARVVMIDPKGGYYNQDLVQNDPDLRQPVLRMISHGNEADAQMMTQYFPDLILLARNRRGSVWGNAEIDGRSKGAENTGGH